MYLFLDFDGVLRRRNSAPYCLEKHCLDSFESAIRPLADPKIVISSTWRLVMSLKELRQLFSPEVAKLIVGVTPELTTQTKHARYSEILSFLQGCAITESWIAIDDNQENFPHDAPLLLTDPDRGFDSACIARLWEHVALSGD